MKLLLLIFVVHSINWNIGKGKGDRGGKKNKPGRDDSSKDYPKTKIPVKDLKEDMGYCQAKYQFFPKKENFNLERVVVIFRHGDRSPMKNNNDEWKKKTCVECPMNGNTITECRNKKCENGELTTKGSKQAKELGNFIKKYYKPLLFDKNIVVNDIGFRATSIKRTHSTLWHVMSGLANTKTISGVNIKKENDGLLRPKNCGFLDTQFAQNACIYEPLNNKLYSELTEDPKRISEKADEIRCSMCNSVSVTCADEDCQNDTLPEIVKLSNSMWKKQVQAVVASDLGKKIIFGRFAKDLLEILSSNKLMYLVSAHDGTLSMILSSLSDESYAWPPYASALFIEVWCKYGKQFVRLVYNDKKVEFTEKPGEYIPINQFTNYLERMKAEDRELDTLCRSGGNSGNKSRLKADLQDNKSKILLDVPLF
jgi:hypothetical protein